MGRTQVNFLGAAAGSSSSMLNITRQLWQDQELRVITFEDPPFMMIHQQEDGTYSYSGYLYEAFLLIAAQLNFRFRIQVHAGSSYGRVHENGTWDGLIGEVVYKRADVALSWFELLKERFQVIDYCDRVPLAHDLYGFFVWKITAPSREITFNMFQNLLKPLDHHVWKMLLVFLLALSLVLRVIVLSVPSATKHTRQESTWSSCFLSIFKTMVSQGWARTPNSSAARIVIMFSWLLGIIIHSSFSANLISLQTVMSGTSPINTLREFNAHPDWQLVTRPGASILSYWKTSSDIEEQSLYRRISEGNGFVKFLPSGENSEVLLQPKVLFFGGVNENFYTLESRACNLRQLLDKPLRRIDGYLVIRRGMPGLKKALNWALLRMAQSGTLARLRSRWLQHYQEGCDAAGHPTSPEPLTLHAVLPLLALVPPGVIVGLLLLLAERLWQKAGALLQTLEYS